MLQSATMTTTTTKLPIENVKKGTDQMDSVIEKMSVTDELETSTMVFSESDEEYQVPRKNRRKTRKRDDKSTASTRVTRSRKKID